MESPAVMWLAIGITLLVVEMLTGTFFFLFLGAGALMVALLAWGMGIGQVSQLLLFGLSAVVAAMAWRKLRPNPDDRVEQLAGAKTLNNRLARYVGREADLFEPLHNGEGRIRLDDTLWYVMSSHDLPVGTRVRVVGVEGTRLHVEPATRVVI